MTILWTDFESRSRCDLPSAGVYNYMLDGSTSVLCLSWAFDDDEVQTWLPGQPVPDRIRHHTGQIRAHNATFERLAFLYLMDLPFKLEQFYCTAAQSRANCGPGSLEDVGRFHGASMRKDHRGAQLIRLLSIPQADGTFRDDPELMAEMIAYCEQDVRAMRAVSTNLRQLSDEELSDYHVSERINDRGVRVDTELCRAATQYADAEGAEIEAIVAEVTNGEVTSVRSPRMREWVYARVGPLAQKMMTVYKDDVARQSIDKVIRANLLVLADENPEEVPEDVAEVIQCADDLWSSSVAKFRRLASLADVEDSRVRGAFVFCGGAQTGRDSSYGAQVHNFARKCARDPEAVRHAVVRGHALAPKFGKRVTDVLKGMLRPALLPAPGHLFVVADWSAIEGRVNPWLADSAAGERKLDVFRSGRDPYIVNGAATFRVTYEEIERAYAETGADERRQIGKVEELACLGPQTRVYTDNGLKAIVDVQTNDLLWDGEEWVMHEGLVFKGKRRVLSLAGVQMTPDHQILAGQEWLEARLVSTSEKCLSLALGTASENSPYFGLSADHMARFRSIWRSVSVRAARRLIGSIHTTSRKAFPLDAVCVPENRPATGASLSSSTPMRAQTMVIDDGYSTDWLRAGTDATTPMTAGTRITAGAVSPCLSLGSQTKRRSSAMWFRLTDGISRIWSLTVSTWIKDTSLEICGSFLSKRTATTSGPCEPCSNISLSWSLVFDILNSGSRNRFTIESDRGPLIVHNCGFGGAAGAFAAMGRAYGVYMSDAEMSSAVKAWRRANPWAQPWWNALEDAYLRAMRNPGREFSAGRVAYLYDGTHLWWALPSGRVLCYPYARLEAGEVTYAKCSWKPAADATEWPRARLWKGLACENVTQACAHDLLRWARRQREDVVLHVHDELVFEVPEGSVDEAAAQVLALMRKCPPWAAGLPLDAQVKVMSRYGKG
jgi:hypothetical protein